MDVFYPTLLFFIIGIAAIGVSSFAVRPDERAWLTRTLLMALIARLFLAGIFAALPETRLFHEDATGYELMGRSLSESWQGLHPPMHILESMTQNYGWPYVAGAIYFVFGPYSALAACFNCVIGTMVVFLIYYLSREFFHVLVARRAALLSAFVPSMMLWSSVAIKDALMALLILIGLASCVSIKRRFSLQAVAGIAFSLLAMQPIRFYMIYFLGFAIVTSLFLERGLGLLSGFYKQVMVVGLCVGLLVIAGISGRTQAGLDTMTLAQVSQFRHGMATSANSGFSADADVSTPTRALLFLPLGVSELLLGPFPWQFGSMRALMAAPETIYWWILFPSMLRGIWWMVRKRFAATSPLVIFAVSMTLAYSLVHGNVGSGFRQRAQIFIILFIFASLGVYRRRCQKARLDPDLLLVDHMPRPPITATTPPPHAQRATQ